MLKKHFYILAFCILSSSLSHTMENDELGNIINMLEPQEIQTSEELSFDDCFMNDAAEVPSSPPSGSMNESLKSSPEPIGVDDSDTIFGDSKDQLETPDQRSLREKQTIMTMCELINFDPQILKKSLIDISDTYQDDIIQKYISCIKVDFNAQDNKGRTALHLAIAAHKIPVVQCLIAHNASPNTKASNGTTPLHIAILHYLAAEQEDSALIDVLLAAGADINAEDNNSDTPLGLIIASRNPALIKSFVEKLKELNIF